MPAPIRCDLVSDKLRTQQTALALAASAGIDARAFRQHRGVDNLVDAICEAGNQGAAAVVVVGHESVRNALIHRQRNHLEKES